MSRGRLDLGEQYKTADGKLRTSSMSYLYDIAEGNIAKHLPEVKYGRNPDVGTSEETVWDQGGLYTYQSAAVTLYASSSEAGDTHEITVKGLDANWEMQEQTVTLTGQTQVEIGTSKTWIRCFRAYNSSADASDGDIYIAETDTLTGGVPDTASKIKAKITQGREQTLMALWTVPANSTAYIVNVFASGDSSKATQVGLYIREEGGVFRIQGTIDLLGTGIDVPQEIPRVYPEKTDIEMRATAGQTGGAVSSRLSLWYETD